MFTDPVGDMVARVRNALMRRRVEVSVPNSRLKRLVLDVFVREGYVERYETEGRDLKVFLKYFQGRSVIQEMKRVSKPSVHVYTPLRSMKVVANGLGTAILSTSKGVLSDREAREHHVGGKILLTVR